MDLPRIVAACFALSGFVVALLAGLASGNGAVQVLSQGLIAMLVCYAVGYAAGLVADRVVRDHVEAYKSARPVDQLRTTSIKENQSSLERNP